MEKRLVIAMALSLLLLLAWSAMLPKQQPVESNRVTDIPPSDTKVTQTVPVQASVQVNNSPSKLINYEQGKFGVVFDEALAAIVELNFKDYPSSKLLLRYGFLLNDNALVFNKLRSDANEISFLHVDQNKRITKRYIFSNNLYDMRLEINYQNLTNGPLTISSPLVLGELEFAPNNEDARYQNVTIGSKEKPLHVTPKKDADFRQVNYLGLRDRYFCAIIDPEQEMVTAYIKKTGVHNFDIGLLPDSLLIPAGQSITEKFHIYLGPQDLRLIHGINPNWAAIVNYGTFDFISQLLLQLLQFFYGIVHNWGWAIVILSIAVYVVLFPLTLKQMRSMKEMQALQPKIEELRKLYKDNPQKLQKEQMELFRIHKVNPLGGCLPLVLQMPIFLALYQTLMRSVFLRGADFLWIKDLSGPDKLFALPFPKPFDSFNLLPILMTIGMFIQQKLSTATSASGTSAQQQKIMLIMMPLLFGFIFYSMPAGLVLYWFINSAIMLANQFYQLRSNK